MEPEFTMTNIEELASAEGGMATIGDMGRRLDACKKRLAGQAWPGMMPTDQDELSKIDRGLTAAIVVLARFVLSKGNHSS